MEDLTVTTATPDSRAVLPSLLVSDLGLSLADAQSLADDVTALIESDRDLVGRPVLRQTYTERLAGSGEQLLLLSRWPIEDDPPTVSIIDNGALDTDTYEVTTRGRHALYRETGWVSSAFRSDELTGEARYPSGTLYYSVPYTAGYIPPGMISTWAAGVVWGVGGSVSYGDAGYGWARSSDRSVQLRFEVTAGSGGVEATEPTWPTVVGDTVVGANNTFTARAAHELPAFVSGALRTLAVIVNRRKRPQTVKSGSSAGIGRVEYEDTGGGRWGDVPQMLRGLR